MVNMFVSLLSKKRKFLFKDVTGFAYKKSMISTCIWSEAETIELKSRRKIKFKKYKHVKGLFLAF